METATRPQLLGMFPALTPAQRYHFDVFGYVIIENSLSQSEVDLYLGIMRRLRDEILAGKDVPEVEVQRKGEYFTSLARFHNYHPAMMDYLVRPNLIGMAEETCGGAVRLNSMTGILNRRDPNATLESNPKFGFHAGIRPPWGSWYVNGLYHTSMVRTFTNLTDIGPDDGGTVFIPGSHKVEAPVEQIIAAAYSDRSLIHHVEAPAGSTVLFTEGLIHATNQHRSDRERVILSGVYTPMMYQPWNRQEPTPEAIANTPEHLRTFVTGNTVWEGWLRNQRHRTLDMTANGHGDASNGSTAGSGMSQMEPMSPMDQPKPKM